MKTLAIVPAIVTLAACSGPYPSEERVASDGEPATYVSSVSCAGNKHVIQVYPGLSALDVAIQVRAFARLATIYPPSIPLCSPQPPIHRCDNLGSQVMLPTTVITGDGFAQAQCGTGEFDAVFFVRFAP